jgi:hypothetical protein
MRSAARHATTAIPDLGRRFLETSTGFRAAAPEFDEFIVLRFKAMNAPPFPFEWVDYNETRLDYGATLSRISARYQQRF